MNDQELRALLTEVNTSAVRRGRPATRRTTVTHSIRCEEELSLAVAELARELDQSWNQTAVMLLAKGVWGGDNHGSIRPIES